MRGMTFVTDNVRFHHSKCIEDEIEKAEHKLEFLPPYSSFLNPIDNVFSKWKGAVKGGNPKDKEELMN